MARPHVPPPSLPHASTAVHVVAFGVVIMQLVVAERYGMFRDEFYYLACAAHPAWGYVDQPPLSIAALSVWKALAGDGLLTVRIPGILLHGASVMLAGLLAREMGGWRLAQVLAAVAVGLMPGALAVGGFYSMNAFELAFWLAGALVAARLLRGGSPRLWLLMGGLTGLGVLNKYSFGLLPVGLVAGLSLSPQRERLREREAWAGAALAVALVLPHLFWQVAHGWPTLEFIRNARADKMARLTTAAFGRDSALVMGPLAVPLAALGLAAMLAGRRLRTFRPLGAAVGLAVVAVLAGGGKPYYLVPAWALAHVAGAVALAAWLTRFGRRASRVVGGACALALLAAGLALAPLAIPLLPVPRFVAYQRALGVRPSSGERHATGVLPQHFADRFGWNEMSRGVARVVADLPAEDRAACLLVAGNYGQAGALRYYARRFGLPPVVSGHNSFHDWGLPPGGPWRVVVAVGFREEDLRAIFEQVDLAATHRHDLAMPYESDLPIRVCRGWRIPPGEAWARLKRYV